MKKSIIINGFVYYIENEKPNIGDVVMRPAGGHNYGHAAAAALSDKYGLDVKYSGPWGGDGDFFTVGCCRIHSLERAERYCRLISR